MKRIGKTVAAVLALGLASLFVVFAILYHNGPGENYRRIKRISSAHIHEALLEPAIQLFNALPSEESFFPPDARGDKIQRVLGPTPYSWISKHDQSLWIECGGGFLHYGFRLDQQDKRRFQLILQIENQEDRIVRATAPNK